MTFLRHFAIASILLIACNGAAENSTSSPAAGAPAAAAADPTDPDALPAAPFCAGSPKYGEIEAALFAGILPDAPVDYFAQRRNVGGVPSPGLTKELYNVHEHGTLCGAASDIAKCKATYAALSPPISIKDHYCFTRGDSVGCLETKAEAMAFLGAVSSIEEAVFIAQYDDYWATCSDYRISARAETLADGRFRLALFQQDGCDDSLRAVIDVARDGTITELSSKKTGAGLGCP
jgi:hypothetical protein